VVNRYRQNTTFLAADGELKKSIFFERSDWWVI